MSDAREVYRFHAEDYDALVSCEDRDGQLLCALRGLRSLQDLTVVEFGAGTGRVTRQLAPHVRSILAFDSAPAMLAVARRRLAQLGADNVRLVLADNASVPVKDASVQLAIAGWTYGHQTIWREHAWREPIQAALREMLRVLAPGGTAIVIETLGTGHTTPFDPPPGLADYYAMLEGELGFTRSWIRTDYEFPTQAEGERLVGRFFGQAMAQSFASSGQRTLPECTGLWTR